MMLVIRFFAVKLWSASTGFAFVTFSEHTAPVSGVLFTPNGKVRVFVYFEIFFLDVVP